MLLLCSVLIVMHWMVSAWPLYIMQFYSIYHAATIRGVSRFKKKPKIPCIHQEGIIHVTSYAELYKHEFSLGFMIHTPVHHCRQLCSQLINFWKKKNRKQMSSFARVLKISGFGEERKVCHKSLASGDAFQQAYNNTHATTSEISYLRWEISISIYIDIEYHVYTCTSIYKQMLVILNE